MPVLLAALWRKSKDEEH